MTQSDPNKNVPAPCGATRSKIATEISGIPHNAFHRSVVKAQRDCQPSPLCTHYRASQADEAWISRLPDNVAQVKCIVCL